MDSLVDRVVNGKIFKNFASFVRGSSGSSKDTTDRPWTADCGMTKEQRTSNSHLMGNNQALLSNGRKRRASEADCGSLSEVPGAIAMNDPHHDPGQFWDSENMQNTIHESRTSLTQHHQQQCTDASSPPLTSRYLQIFTFTGDFGEISTGLAVTKSLVWQLNAIYRSEYKINECTESIREIDEKLGEWELVIMDLRLLMADAATEHDRTPFIVSLQEAETMVASNEERRLHLEKRLQYWIDEKELPLRQMLQNLSVVLESNNLLEEIPDESEDNFQDFEENHQFEKTPAPSLYSPTPSEVAQQKLENDQREALEILQERRLHLQAAQAKVENWKDYCHEEYRKFLQLQSDRVMDASKTDFDVEMIQQGQAATRDCIEAEMEMEQIIAYARLLRVNFEEFDQESGFVSLVEDGHVESMDPTEAYSVDRKRIERWMDEDDEKLQDPAEVDDWECKTVGANDSVSIVATQVATGKERKRIDRWRSICELVEVDAQEEDEE